MKFQLLPILIPLVLTQFISCKKAKIDTDYIISASWQWDRGFKIGDGDFVDFDTTNFYTISNDTIYRKGIPRCIVIETDKKKHLMKIKSLNGEIGYYDDNEQFTR